MRLTVNAGVFQRTLSRLQRVVERRNTIPILGNVLLAAGPDTITITATDLDMSMIETIPATVEEQGSITASAQILFDVARKFASDAEIRMETKDSSLIVKSGRSRLTLHTLPATDFPEVKDSQFDRTFQMSGRDLASLLNTVGFAISTEETRYYLNGVYFHGATAGNKKVVRAVATDGHRLASTEIEAPAGAEDLMGVIIPRKAIAEATKMAEATKEPITIGISDREFRLTTDATVLTSKLIDGTFPDYNRVIPRGNKKVLKAEIDAVSAAIERVSVIASERGHAVKISLKDNKLVVSTNNADTGNATDEVDVEYADDPIEIGFNSRYVIDVLAQIPGKTFEAHFDDPGSPTLFKPGGDSTALFVLMPMRV